MAYMFFYINMLAAVEFIKLSTYDFKWYKNLSSVSYFLILKVMTLREKCMHLYHLEFDSGYSARDGDT